MRILSTFLKMQRDKFCLPESIIDRFRNIKSLGLLIFLLALHTVLFAQEDKMLVPEKFRENGIQVLKIQKGVITASNASKSQVIQYNFTGTPLMFYELGIQEQRRIYTSNFGNDSLYESTRSALRVNGVTQPPVEVHSFYIDSTNTVFALAVAQVAKPQPGGQPGVDFIIDYFYSLLEINTSGKANIYPVADPVINGEFEISTLSGFYKQDNHFIFTLNGARLKQQGNYFLGKWKLSHDKRLIFDSFVPCELPSSHIKTQIGYNLLNFVRQGEYLSVLIDDHIINTSNGKIIPLPVKNKPAFGLKDLRYGSSFHIPYAICDLQVTHDTLKVIYRINDEYHFTALSSKNSTVLKEINLNSYLKGDKPTSLFFYEDKLGVISSDKSSLTFFTIY